MLHQLKMGEDLAHEDIGPEPQALKQSLVTVFNAQFLT